MQNESADESWLEEQCLEAIQSQPDYETQFIQQRDILTRSLWTSFQDSATSIAQLYRDRSGVHDAGALWLPFQRAAGTVTTLYKESSDGVKRTSELAVHVGYQRRTRELADWARSKRRRYIRRDDLLSYLAGKPLPPVHHSNHYSRRLSPKPESHHNNSNSNNNTSQQMPNETTNDLHTFKEALVRRPARGPELYAFVANEIAHHCTKRPASPLDVNMDVQSICSNKRQRFM